MGNGILDSHVQGIGVSKISTKTTVFANTIYFDFRNNRIGSAVSYGVLSSNFYYAIYVL